QQLRCGRRAHVRYEFRRLTIRGRRAAALQTTTKGRGGTTMIGRILGAAAALAMTAAGAMAGELTVAHYGSLVQGAPYAIALEKNMFKEAGVPIDGIVAGKGGGDTVRAT